MYKSRHQSYRDQVLQSPEVRDDQASVRSEASMPLSTGRRSRSITPPPRLSIPTNLARTERVLEKGRRLTQQSTRRSTVRSKRTNPAEEEEEEEEEESGEEEEEIERTVNGGVKVPYSNTFRKTISKKMTWHPIPTPVLAQVRRILNDNYIKTLSHIAGSTESSDHPDAERVLRRIAQHTDRKLKTVLVPGFFATNQLNTATNAATEQLKTELNVKLKEVAKQILMEHKRVEYLEVEKEEFERLKQERDSKKQDLETYSLHKQKRLKPNDYVQSLMRYPVSSAFD